MRTRAPLGLVLAVALAAPARAYVPEQTPHRAAEAAGLRALARPAARRATAGLVVMRGGRVLFQRNAARALKPASVLKLLTTTTAMLRFGPDHRFATRALVERRRTTVARLWLVGGGDPTLATESYRRKRFLPKPTDEIKRPAFATRSPTAERLAARVAAAGIRRVGRVVADESLFDARRTQPGWVPRYYLGDDPNVTFLSALTIDEGHDGPEGPALPDPALAAARALARALEDRGVRVDGAVERGRAPAGAAEVARVASPPLREIVDFTNRYSINVSAEMLLKGLGARFGGAGTTDAGVGVVRATMRDLRVPLRGARIADGSGLSLRDRLAPRTLAVLLDRIATRPGPEWDALRASLPTAGGPGTLIKRMARAPTRGRVHAKTGALRDVRAMAGWADASDGVPVVFVAIFDHASPPALGGALDLLGLALVLFPGT